MNTIAEDIRDAVQEELMEVTAAIKPPASKPEIKHLPDAGLIIYLITEALIPVLTGFISGMLVHLATRRDSDSTQQKLNELDAQLKALAHRNEPEDAAIVDAVIGRLAKFKSDTGGPEITVGAAIGLQVAAELRRFHLSETTSARLAPVIVTRILSLLNSPPPSAS